MSRHPKYQAAADALMATHSPISALANDRKHWVFLDYPIYKNIGDILIMLGTEAFIQKHTPDSVTRFSYHNFLKHYDKYNTGEHVLLLQGGGNFGDLHPNHQPFREEVIALCTQARIIQLPQTLHYQNHKNLLRVAEKYNQHPDLHLFFRDNASLSTARNSFTATCELAADMAHHLYPSLQKCFPLEKSKQSPLFLIRRDNENDDIFSDFFASLETRDWDDFISLAMKAEIRLWEMLHKLSNIIPLPPNTIAKCWQKRILKHITGIFSHMDASPKWVTSRLHGMILASLLDKPLGFIDNNYHKNLTYHQAWKKHLPTIEMMTSLEKLRRFSED